jgi:3-deoxy-7-phosphoheptulonate synthase
MALHAGTSGNVQIAADAIMAASHPHAFMGVSKSGLAAVVETAVCMARCLFSLAGSRTTQVAFGTAHALVFIASPDHDW